MIEITRRLEIDAGHRLMKHPGKCRNYHGHRYRFDITVIGVVADDGMVIDYGIVKREIGRWLDENWDHGMILQGGDPMLETFAEWGFPPPKVAILGCPPTAENLSRILCQTATKLLSPHGVKVTRVRCYETPNCYADYVPPVGTASQ